jgi:hypothetical protein
MGLINSINLIIWLKNFKNIVIKPGSIVSLKENGWRVILFDMK